MHPIHTLDGADWDEVAGLFAAVGWGRREPDQVRAAFEKSSHVVFIRDGDRLAAMGRTIDDGRYYAVLVDIAVHPDFQGRGLGRTVTDHLRAQLDGYRFVTLTAAPGKQDFYRKLGWVPQTSAMIWPQSDLQREQHT
jgi:ribosomal protein S18 acetylase RimI-like enzyme